jgi:hypothetical protein
VQWALQIRASRGYFQDNNDNMNPYIYINFKTDMLEAVSGFISNTAYKVYYLGDNSIVLSNNNKFINFYLDGMSMIETIQIGDFEKAIFELFDKNGISDKYPFDIEHKYSYEKWNKYKVKKILEVLNTDLRRYIE